jgi:hypothetical protein
MVKVRIGNGPVFAITQNELADIQQKIEHFGIGPVISYVIREDGVQEGKTHIHWPKVFEFLK